MDYIYDIVLNFQNNYYDFYEWKSSDKIINVKKILVYTVNTQDYLNLKYNDVVLDTNILPPKIKMILVTNGIEVMGLLLDNTGRIIKRSGLLFDEADEVLEEKDVFKTLPLKYKRNVSKQHLSSSRLNIEKSKFLENYFFNIDINKDKYLLKYIYYDIYNKEENNINKIYEDLKKMIHTNINPLYECIQKVSIELKK